MDTYDDFIVIIPDELSVNVIDEYNIEVCIQTDFGVSIFSMTIDQVEALYEYCSYELE